MVSVTSTARYSEQSEGRSRLDVEHPLQRDRLRHDDANARFPGLDHEVAIDDHDAVDGVVSGVKEQAIPVRSSHDGVRLLDVMIGGEGRDDE